MKILSEKYWHDLFEAGVFIKACTGVIEIISGFLLLTIKAQTLGRVLGRYAQGEIDDIQDFFLNYAYQYVRHLTVATKNFAGIWILGHGLINFFLVFGLWKKRPWAYLVAIGVLVSFVFYQIFRVIRHHSILLEVLTIIDILFAFVIWHEYNYITKKSKTEQALLK